MVEQSSQLQNKDPRFYPPAVFLMGPTASGKSSVALQIAERLPVEIVSVDSAQVYRYLDIGTAKPDAKTRATLPHHLIDLLEPPERYSAARFVDDALKAMHEITQRGNMPLLVGGTMLYFHALLQGLSQLPSADSGLRGEIETKRHAQTELITCGFLECKIAADPCDLFLTEIHDALWQWDEVHLIQILFALSGPERPF